MSDRSGNQQPLVASLRECAIVNLRGDPSDRKFSDRVRGALNLTLPMANHLDSHGANRLVWVGPDDWFWIGMPGTEARTVELLTVDKADDHYAITDVSGGYFLVTLSGPQAIDILASGCPLDLHRSEFKPGMAAGSHFYQTAVRLWMIDDEPRFELLVRRSFSGYFWQVLAAATRECGLDRQNTV